jgi:hypothetical protein
MNAVPAYKPGPTLISDRDPRVARLLAPVILADDPLSTSMAWSIERSVAADWPVTVTREVLDTVISHIYRAGLVIRRCCEGVGSALGERRDYVTDELDAAIRSLQMAAHESQLHRGVAVGASGPSPQG